MNKDSRGFTLIELIVVIVILGVMLSLRKPKTEPALPESGTAPGK